MQSAQRISQQSEGLPRRASQGFFQLPNSIAENLWLLTPAEKDVVIIIHRFTPMRKNQDGSWSAQGSCAISDEHWENWTGKKARIKDAAIRGLKDKGLKVSGEGKAAAYSFDRTGWEGWISSHHVREKARTAGRQKSAAVPAKPDMQVHPECRARGCGRLCEDEPKVISISSAVSSQVEQPVAREEIPPEQPVAQPPPRKEQPTKPTEPAIDANLQRIIGAFLSLGIGLSESDLRRCLKIWVTLSAAEKNTATAYALARAENEWSECAERYIPRPWNYLGEKHWERRPAHPNARQQSMSKGERASKQAREEFLREVQEDERKRQERKK
jgi:hypothetical protein